MKTFIVKETTYRQLKKISLMEVWNTGLYGANWDDFLRYIITNDYRWNEPIELEDCVGIDHGWDARLLALNFVERVEDEFECGLGDRYNIRGTEVMLCGSPSGICMAITSTSDGDAGKIWTWGRLYPCKNFPKITMEEFKATLGYFEAEWEKIYATRIPNKN